MPQCTVARWETDRVAPNASHIGEMCDYGRVAGIDPGFFFPPIQPLQPGGSVAPSFTDRSLKMAATLILTDDTFQKKCWKPPNLCWLILAPPGAGPATPWSRLKNWQTSTPAA